MPSILGKSAVPVPGMAPPNYQTEDDSRTLERAAEVMAQPKRHAAAHKHLTRKMAMIHRAFGKGKR